MHFWLRQVKFLDLTDVNLVRRPSPWLPRSPGSHSIGRKAQLQAMCDVVHIASRHNWWIYGISWKWNEPEVWAPAINMKRYSNYFCIPYSRLFNLLVLLCFQWGKRANCSIPQFQAAQFLPRLKILRGGFSLTATEVQNKKCRTIVCECKTDKTHFQIVRRLRDFREK